MRVICLPLTRVRLVLYKVKFCGCIDQRKCLSSIVFLPNTYSTVILEFFKKCKKIREITFHKTQINFFYQILCIIETELRFFSTPTLDSLCVVES